MQKIAVLMLCLIILNACSKHDPILPGKRTAVFETEKLQILNEPIENLPDKLEEIPLKKCDYTQDSSNVVWKGDKKIFSGFPTSNYVKSSQKPLCSGEYVYAGLTTGELVKVNPSNKKILWIADIYQASNMTGGSSILDIVAPIVIKDNYIYAGGLGDAFCKIKTSSGDKKWCIPIGVAVPFIVTEKVSFVVATDEYLYAIRNSDGTAYWKTKVNEQKEPFYSDKIITIGKQKIDAINGSYIK